MEKEAIFYCTGTIFYCTGTEDGKREGVELPQPVEKSDVPQMGIK